VITLLGSGLTLAHVRQIADGLLQRPIAGTLVVVAGRNAALREGRAVMPAGRARRLRRLGFVDYLDGLVAASDLVITKAGGLIVGEVLARGRPARGRAGSRGAAPEGLVRLVEVPY
jgi:processive 1,2-diacylglycerol beta-glucosyltransferase